MPQPDRRRAAAIFGGSSISSALRKAAISVVRVLVEKS
jgi:hypothetical protein